MEGGEATVLEEGLATWFQDERMFHCKAAQRFVEEEMNHSRPYAEARERVCRCRPRLVPAVKLIRESGTWISRITPR